jgi:hypothetical protein
MFGLIMMSLAAETGISSRDLEALLGIAMALDFAMCSLVFFRMPSTLADGCFSMLLRFYFGMAAVLDGMMLLVWLAEQYFHSFW